MELQNNKFNNPTNVTAETTDIHIRFKDILNKYGIKPPSKTVNSDVDGTDYAQKWKSIKEYVGDPMEFKAASKDRSQRLLASVKETSSRLESVQQAINAISRGEKEAVTKMKLSANVPVEVEQEALRRHNRMLQFSQTPWYSWRSAGLIGSDEPLPKL